MAEERNWLLRGTRYLRGGHGVSLLIANGFGHGGGCIQVENASEEVVEVLLFVGEAVQRAVFRRLRARASGRS